LTLTKLLPNQGLSQHKIQIEAEADDIPDGVDNLQVTLCVEYTGGYPNELPNLLLEHDDERIEEADSQSILENLRKVVRGYISLIDCWPGRVMHPFN